MIPKIIHYCWFGKGPKPKLAMKCIESWKAFCSDYKIIEWNEENFDINQLPYVKEAYDNRKFAFVTDYVRLYATYNYGGIYMDTDVEVIKPLDEFLVNRGFSGFESQTQIPTGIMAAEKGLPIIKELMDYYIDKHFVNPDGSFNTTTNVIIITELLSRCGFLPNGKLQCISDFTLYPQDFFCPLDDSTGKLYKTSNTATIHWFNKSWCPEHIRLRAKVTKIFHRLFGVNCFHWLKRITGK